MKKTQEKIQQLELQILESQVTKEKELLITEMKKIGIEKLPYAYSALKTFIDAETMNLHYNKHYKSYVDKLNAALSKKKYGDLDLEKIIRTISRFNKTIRNNAGGAFNHALFWNMLTPEPKKLEGELYKKITKQWGTFSNFKKEFEKQAKERFGSGWVWLVLTSKNTLKIMSTPNQDNPLMNVIEGGGFPLLGLDLWEHAYYLKYQNKRDEYITNFWKVVNWDFVTKMYEMKTKTKLIESKIKKSVLFEGRSDYIRMCSDEDNEFFQNLLSRNEISSTYGKGIYQALFKVPWLEFRKKDLSINRMQGFYKDGERHNISYLAGNHRAFCMIVKSVNEILRQNGQSKIFLKDKSPEEQLEGVKKLIDILVKNAPKIFDENNPFFQAIMTNLGQSIVKGEKIEKVSEIRLSKKFGQDNVKIESGFGLDTDASEGLDGSIKIDGRIYKCQIKPYKTSFIEDGKLVVLTSSTVSNYKVDFMIFSNTQNTLVVKNQNTELGINAYVFPPEDLIYKLT
jgi:Fe-Mn family superoxide dismutase